MKSIYLFSLFVSLFLLSCNEIEPNTDVPRSNEIKSLSSIPNSSLIHNPVTADEEVSPEKAAIITFSEKVFDFGDIKEGDQVMHTFKFKNTGKSPLIISNAQGSCGCTVPEWPTYPISPGQSDEIKVRFNSKDRLGEVDKTVTITANTLPNKTMIRIVGAVNE